MHDRFEVRREYPAAVDRVFANWADPRLKRKWFPEPGNHYTYRQQGVTTQLERLGASPG